MVSMFGAGALPLSGAGIPSATAPVVIGGCGSSGTTLLRKMLDRHPEVFCGPESTVFLRRMSSSRDIAERFGFEPAQVAAWRRESATRVEFIERFQAACLAKSGKRIWAEKTPENIRAFPQIARQFPRARLIHLIRDGRDVACSLRQAEWMPLEKITGGQARTSHEALDACLRYWAERVRFGRAMRHHPGYLELRYEELVQEPRSTLRKLLAFLELEWDERVLQAAVTPAARADGPLASSSIGRWRREFGRAEAELVERQTGRLLRDLGYVQSSVWSCGLPPTSARPPAPRPPRAATLKARASEVRRTFRRELLALWLSARDAQVPLGLRCLPLCAAAYVAAPNDLIADYSAPLGWMDDLGAVALALGGMAALLPAAVKQQRRREAALASTRRIWAMPAATSAPRDALRWLWSRLIGAISGPAYVVDNDLRFVSASPSAFRTWGMAPQEVLGKPVAEVFPSVTAGEAYKALLRAVRTSQPVRVTTTSVLYGRRMNVKIQPLTDSCRVKFRLAA